MKKSNTSKNFDTIIGNGKIFDAKKKSFYDGSIGIINGTIAEIGIHLESSHAQNYIDAKNQMVLPGLIDFHAHCYWGGTSLGINPTKINPKSGVTTCVDFGSAGAGNFEGFYHHVIKNSTVAIYALLNLSYIGLTSIGDTEVRFGELFDDRLIDVHSTTETIEEYPDVIKGLKIRLGPATSGKNSYYALTIANQLSRNLEIPLAIHATSPPPFIDEILPTLKAGDVFTHCFNYDGFMRILEQDKTLKKSVLKARDQGVLFDVGHGVSCLSFDIVKSSLLAGFYPDIISSDLHAYNINGPVFDLPTTLSKFIALGMPMAEVLYRATLAPAMALGVDHLIGSLEVGKQADIVIAHWSVDKHSLWDSRQTRLEDRQLQIISTYRAGQKLSPIEDGRSEHKWKPGIPLMFKAPND